MASSNRKPRKIRRTRSRAEPSSSLSLKIPTPELRLTGPHVFDRDFANILKQIVIHAISCECGHKTSHSRLGPPVVRHFNLQSVVREFHQAKYARNSLSMLETQGRGMRHLIFVRFADATTRILHLVV